MLKISDFSKLTHVSVRMLRYYDSEGLLKPAVTDRENGYRLYTAEQVPSLQKIIMFRDLGFGISEIHELMEKWDNAAINNAFQKKILETRTFITEAENQIKRMEAALTHIKGEALEQVYNVTLRTIPSYPVISLRRHVSDFFKEGTLWAELCEYIAEHHVATERSSNNNIAIYHDDEFIDNNVDIEVCMIVKKLGKSKGDITYRMTEPVDQMACMMVYGPYSNIAGAYQSFTRWLSCNEAYQMSSPSRQVTIIDERDTSNPEEYLTEIQIPLISSR